MRAIDADELVENILNWQKMLPDDKSKELLTQVIHCIDAKRTVFDLQKLICEIHEQKLDYEYVLKEDIKDATVYNGALDDVMEKVKMSTNPYCWDKFTWEMQNKEIDDLELE